MTVCPQSERDIIKRIAGLAGMDSEAGALRELDRALESGALTLSDDVRHLRMVLLDGVGRFAEAFELTLEEWERRRAEASPSRYPVALSLGALAEKCRTWDESIDWYKTAMLTSLQEPETCGASALRDFLRLRAGALEPSERQLAEEIVRKAWAILGEPGAITVDDLVETARLLEETCIRRGTW